MRNYRGFWRDSIEFGGCSDKILKLRKIFGFYVKTGDRGSRKNLKLLVKFNKYYGKIRCEIRISRVLTVN